MPPTIALRIAVALALSCFSCATTTPRPGEPSGAVPPSTSGAPSPPSAPVMGEPAHRRNVAILVYPGVELLDFSGPGEAFSSNRAFRVYTVAPTHEPILSQGFVRVTPEFSIDDAPSPDIVLVPGGSVGSVLRSEATKAWLRRALASDELTMSVCNGALVLAAIGALDGLTATTHWSVDPKALAAMGRGIVVMQDKRYIDHGRVMTTAGVSAGIDGAMHVIQRLAGEESAWKTARYMQYDWSPEAGTIPGRLALTPGQREAMKAWVFQDWSAAAKAYGTLVEREPENTHARARLGDALFHLGQREQGLAEMARAQSAGQRDAETLSSYATDLFEVERFADAARAFMAEAEATEAGRGGAFYNAACAFARQGDADAAILSLTRAAEAGQKLEGRAVQDDDLASLRSDPRFIELVHGHKAEPPAPAKEAPR